MPGKLHDLPPQGFALRGLLLDTQLQGFDLLGVPLWSGMPRSEAIIWEDAALAAFVSNIT